MAAVARQRCHRRADDVDQPAVLGHVGLQAVAEDGYPADRLDEAEVMGAGDVHVVLAKREPGELVGVKAEHVRMTLDVVQRDGAGREAARPVRNPSSRATARAVPVSGSIETIPWTPNWSRSALTPFAGSAPCLAARSLSAPRLAASCRES